MEVAEIARWSRRAEVNGFDSVWISEDPYFRDATTILSLLGASTKRVKIASCILNVYTKNPVYMAMAAATINEICNGRLILGIGRGVRSLIEGELHIRYGSYLTYVREYIECLRKLLAGESVVYDGKEIELTGARLRFQSKPIPIYLAATGPKMLRLAGELADGVILNSCTSVKHTKFVYDILTESRRTSAKKPGLVCSLWTSIDNDVEKAYESVRKLVGFLLSIPSFGETFLNRSELPSDFLEDLRKAFRWDEEVGDPIWHLEQCDYSKVQEVITDEIVDALTVCGTIADCRRRIKKYFDAGATTAIITPMTAKTFARMHLLI
jgi:5,10-methylenetetrahydromethanopterin reductase